MSHGILWSFSGIQSMLRRAMDIRLERTAFYCLIWLAVIVGYFADSANLKPAFNTALLNRWTSPDFLAYLQNYPATFGFSPNVIYLPWEELVVSVLLRLPVILVIVALSVSRLRSIGWSPWLSVLLLVPYVNMALIGALCFVPARPVPDQPKTDWFCRWFLDSALYCTWIGFLLGCGLLFILPWKSNVWMIDSTWTAPDYISWIFMTGLFPAIGMGITAFFGVLFYCIPQKRPIWEAIGTAFIIQYPFFVYGCVALIFGGTSSDNVNFVRYITPMIFSAPFAAFWAAVVCFMTDAARRYIHGQKAEPQRPEPELEIALEPQPQDPLDIRLDRTAWFCLVLLVIMVGYFLNILLFAPISASSYAAFGHPSSFMNYLVDFIATLGFPAAPGVLPWHYMVLCILLRIPVLLVIAALCVSRLRSVGWSGWLAALIFVPFVNLLLTMILCVVPARRLMGQPKEHWLYRWTIASVLNCTVLGYFLGSIIIFCVAMLRPDPTILMEALHINPWYAPDLVLMSSMGLCALIVVLLYSLPQRRGLWETMGAAFLPLFPSFIYAVLAVTFNQLPADSSDWLVFIAHITVPAPAMALAAGVVYCIFSTIHDQRNIRKSGPHSAPQTAIISAEAPARSAAPAVPTPRPEEEPPAHRLIPGSV